MFDCRLNALGRPLVIWGPRLREFGCVIRLAVNLEIIDAVATTLAIFDCRNLPDVLAGKCLLTLFFPGPLFVLFVGFCSSCHRKEILPLFAALRGGSRVVRTRPEGPDEKSAVAAWLAASPIAASYRTAQRMASAVRIVRRRESIAQRMRLHRSYAIV
jgi:hypothetical protein